MVNFRNKTETRRPSGPLLSTTFFQSGISKSVVLSPRNSFIHPALAQIDIIEGISAFAILPVGITTDDHFAICKPHINVSDDLWFTDG